MYNNLFVHLNFIMLLMLIMIFFYMLTQDILFRIIYGLDRIYRDLLIVYELSFNGIL